MEIEGILVDSVFVVQHLDVLGNGEEDVKLIGVFSSLGAANAAVGRLSGQPGFRDFPSIVEPGKSEMPDGFYIDEYHLDMVHWREGYATLGTNDD